MKVEIVDDNKVVECKPLTLTITLETRDEALELWHRLNIADNVFRCEPCHLCDMPLPSRWDTNRLWGIIDEYMKSPL